SDKNGAPTAVFSAHYRLLNLYSGAIMGTKQVEARVPAGGKDNAALARACESALEKGLAETTAWVLETMRAGKGMPPAGKGAPPLWNPSRGK
ncbi:MAG: hypothetical protein LBH65_03840, partial [Desulfovibrio sp.]|nr:hypothetical protein [Desulfovibrio sp.]